jgi:hypothetical protein
LAGIPLGEVCEVRIHDSMSAPATRSSPRSSVPTRASPRRRGTPSCLRPGANPDGQCEFSEASPYTCGRERRGNRRHFAPQSGCFLDAPGIKQDRRKVQAPEGPRPDPIAPPKADDLLGVSLRTDEVPEQVQSRRGLGRKRSFVEEGCPHHVLIGVVSDERSLRSGEFVDASATVTAHCEGLGAHGVQASFHHRDPTGLARMSEADVSEAKADADLPALTSEMCHGRAHVRGECCGTGGERHPIGTLEMHAGIHIASAVVCHPSGDLRQGRCGRVHVRSGVRGEQHLCDLLPQVCEEWPAAIDPGSMDRTDNRPAGEVMRESRPMVQAREGGGGPATPVSSVLAELTVFLLLRPAATEKLLAQHVDDGRGRCKACSVGAQQDHHLWPCTIYAAAVRASRHPGS